MRVYEAARDYNVESKEILDFLAELGHPVRSASSNVPLEAVDALEERYADSKTPEAETTGEETAPATEPEPDTPPAPEFLESDITPKVEKIVIGATEEKTAPPRELERVEARAPLPELPGGRGQALAQGRRQHQAFKRLEGAPGEGDQAFAGPTLQ